MHDRLRHLAAKGIDAKAIFEYATMVSAYTPIADVESYLSSDLYNCIPNLGGDRGAYQQLRHACLDAIGEASVLIIQLVETYCGICDHTLKFEHFLGQDVVVSICVDTFSRQAVLR